MSGARESSVHAQVGGAVGVELVGRSAAGVEPGDGQGGRFDRGDRGAQVDVGLFEFGSAQGTECA